MADSFQPDTVDSFRPDSFEPDGPSKKPIIPTTAPRTETVATENTPPSVPQVAQQDSFQPDSFTPDTPSKSSSLTTEFVKPDESAAIAARHGMDPQKLQDIAPYFGINLLGSDKASIGEAAKFGAKSAVGEIGSGPMLGAPQFAYKKLALTENERKAVDELRALSHERLSTLSASTEFGRQIVAPAVGIPSVLGKLDKGASLARKALGAGERIAGGAAVGGAAGYMNSPEGKEVEGAQTGAALGGAIGSAAEVVGLALGRYAGKSEREANAIRGQQAEITKAQEQIAQDTAHSEDIIAEHVFTPEERRKPLTPEEANTIVKEQVEPRAVAEYAIVGGKEGPPAPTQLAEDVINSRRAEFQEQLGGKDILEHASRQGEEATVNSYQEFVKYKQAERAIDAMDHGARDQPGFWTGLVNKLSDNQYALRRLDDKYGIDSEAVLRELNKAKNRLTFARKDTRQALEDIHREAVSSKTDEAIQGTTRIYDALDTGNVASLSPEEQGIAQKFQKYFQDRREYANGLVQAKDPGIAPLSIPKQENYVPHVALPTHEIIPLVEAKLPLAIQEASQYLERPIHSLADLSEKELAFLAKAKGEISDLMGFAKWADSSAKVTDGASLARELDAKLHSSQGQVALESRARAAMERTGDMPSFILQKNLYKLADTWAHNTFNHLFLRRGLERMQYEADKLRKFGATKEAEYIDTIIRDTLGIRPGTAAEGFLRANITLQRSIDPLIQKYGPTSPTGLALNAVKNTPDIMYGLMRNIYGNLLGAGNMYAALQNLVTGFTRLAPELGTRYGYITVVRGMAKAALNFNEYYKLAEHIGNVPAGFGREGEAALAEGLFRSKAFNLSKEGYAKLSEWGMKLFETSEKFNRVLAIASSDMMAADIAHGSPIALASLQKLPVTIQRRILSARGDQEANALLLSQYLNDTTQFNYNRSSLFEFGRTLGPVLSTFSKWPTAILGEAAYTYRSHGLGAGTLRNMERLVVPFSMLAVMQYGLQKVMHADSPADMPDRAKKFLGSNGLTAMSPVGALSKFATGEIFSPPAVDLLVKQLIIPAFKGEGGAVLKGLDTALHNYAPGAGFIRFLTDDMVTYLTGHKPEGSTFTERTVEGARKLGIK